MFIYIRSLYISAEGNTAWGDWVRCKADVIDKRVRDTWRIGIQIAIQVSHDGKNAAYTYTQAGPSSLRRYNHQTLKTDTVLI